MKIFLFLGVPFIAWLLYVIWVHVIVSMIVTRNPLGSTSRNYYYNPITRNIFYSPGGNWFELGYSQVPGLKKGQKVQLLDENYLVIDKKIILDGVEQNLEYAPDFKRLKAYLINNQKVYFYSRDGVLQLVKDADPKHFETLSAFDFGRDSQHVFIKSEIVAGADPHSFRFLKESSLIAWDKMNVYFRASRSFEDRTDRMYSLPHQGEPIQESQELLMDKSHVYFFDYKNLQIRKEVYQEASKVLRTSTGIQIDDNFIPRKDYLPD